jgi:hypothetical protein
MYLFEYFSRLFFFNKMDCIYMMKKLVLLIVFAFCSYTLFAAQINRDSLKQQTQVKINSIDSLKQQLKLISDSLKGPAYTQIAAYDLKYATFQKRKKQLIYQNAAISNTLLAIRIYSKYHDTTGLRISFDNLAKVYHAQHKYSHAKWFILQSNTLSRDKKDNPNIIASLIELASIKSDINDYSLAMRDLNEALMLSSKNHYPQQESEVQLNYALLFNNMKNYVKAGVSLKRHQAIDDSIKRDEEAKLIAKQNTKDSLQHVKDSLQQVIKKTLYLKQQEALRKQLFQKTSVVIILILIITLITIGIFFLYRRKRTGFWRSGIKRKH